MSTLVNEKTKNALASYARSFIGAALAVYMTGNTDVKDIATAGIAALLPVLIRWVNPNDGSFGRTK